MSLLNESDFKRLAQLVTETTGNRVREQNFSMLESRMTARLLKLGLRSMVEYWDYFTEHEGLEREAIQSLMTTHHTFFFREYAHFEILENWLEEKLPELKARFEKTRQPVRVWSAACSRGQEVYSLAMFLDKNLRKRHGVDFHVVGTDIDKDSVAYAKNGVYPIKEVNTLPHEYLNGYWKRGTGPVREFAAAHPALKAFVSFQSLNLLEVDAWAPGEAFDVIFCRNVFIYFTDVDIEKIAHSLRKRLQPEALFVSGMSEPLRFASWKLPTLGSAVYVNSARAEASTPGGTPPAVPVPARAPAPAASVAKVVPISAAPSVRAAKYRVLCVDDSPTIQTLMRKIFAEDPLCDGVETAGNGREAREKLDAGRYDLITLDIHMPEVTGIEFLERLYRRQSDPPVLMVSSVNRSDAELATRSLTLGAFDYVEKPSMNNLQKSRDELHMKAKMALRHARTSAGSNAGEFDVSISRQIIVPDASQCLRILVAGAASRPALEQILRAQDKELRSPPTLVLLPSEHAADLELSALEWTKRSLVTLKDPTQALKPNAVYFLRGDDFAAYLPTHRLKSVSLQVLEHRPWTSAALKTLPELQVLIDERAAGGVDEFRVRHALRVSDVAPATSFASLSVEFFAKVRKAA